MLFIESVRNAIGIIKPVVFMLENRPAFHNVWSSIMSLLSLTPKQLLCTWHDIDSTNNYLFTFNNLSNKK